MALAGLRIVARLSGHRLSCFFHVAPQNVKHRFTRPFLTHLMIINRQRRRPYSWLRPLINVDNWGDDLIFALVGHFTRRLIHPFARLSRRERLLVVRRDARIMVRVVVHVNVNVTIEPMAYGSAVCARHRRVLRAAGIRSTRYREETGTRGLYEALILIRQGRLISLNGRALRSSVLIVTVYRVRRRSRLLLRVKVIRHVIRGTMDLRYQIATCCLSNVCHLLRVNRYARQEGLKFSVRPVISITILIQERIRASDKDGNVMNVFLPSFLRVETNRSNARAVTRFPSVALRLNGHHYLYLIRFQCSK